jgi:hypothetical protein
MSVNSSRPINLNGRGRQKNSLTRNGRYFRFIHFVSFRFVSSSFPLLPTCSQQVSRVFVITFDHIQTHTTVGRTPLDEGSVRRRDFYLTTHKHSQETNIHVLVGFEPTIPASARPKAHALDRAAIRIGLFISFMTLNS